MVNHNLFFNDKYLVLYFIYFLNCDEFDSKTCSDPGSDPGSDSGSDPGSGSNVRVLVNCGGGVGVDGKSGPESKLSLLGTCGDPINCGDVDIGGNTFKSGSGLAND